MVLMVFSAMQMPSVIAQPSPPAPPPIASLPLAQPNQEPVTIDVPYQQTITIKVPGAARALSVNPSVVEARVPAPGVIELHAAAFGQTFLHLWTESGRITRALHVVPPIPKTPRQVRQRLAAEELASHLVFEYSNRFRSLRRGPSLSETSQHTTTSFDHDLLTRMETPYGNLSGRVGFQRVDHTQSLSTWSAGIGDGRLGALRHFDVNVGDTAAGYSDLTLPLGTVRGTSLRYYQFKPYVADAFYGRQRLGFAAGLSPQTEISDDVFFSGGRLQDVGRPWTWGLAYAGASGTDRVETQTSQAVEGDSWYWFSPDVALGAQMGRTQEDAYGYRVKSIWNGPKWTLNTTYRNLSQRYENLLGRSADQGERGVVVSSTLTPTRRWRLHQYLDVYDDTLFANPEEPGVSNLDVEIGSDVNLTERTQWISTYSRRKLLGRLFPTDANNLDTSLRYRIGYFPLLSNGSIFTAYRYRDLRSVNAPSSDFKANSVELGAGAPFFDDFSWQASQEWTFLEDLLSQDHTVPRETTAGVNYYRRFEWIPITLRGGFNFTRSSHADSPNSFVSNESRWIWDAGVRYNLTQDTEAFLDTRFLRRQRHGDGRDYEINLETGVRCFFDTGISWQPSATLSGVVFQDLNGDGAQQAGEPGLPKVTVAAGANREAVTDSAGRFYFGRVRGKQLQVAVDLSTVPQGYVSTSSNVLTIDLSRPPSLPLLFGFVAQAEIRARVFIDANGNGQYDATDVPLESVRVRLGDQKTVETDRSGWVFFRGISPGAYTITLNVEDLAPGYVPATPVSQQRTVTEGKAILVDFPIQTERSIGGRVYVDENRNGRYDDELTLSNITICLDDGRRVKTREDGRYLFKQVSAGSHRVRLNCGEPLPNYVPLSATTKTVELSAQPAREDAADFRLAAQSGAVQDVPADVRRAREDREREEAMAAAVIGARRAEQTAPQPAPSAKPAAAPAAAPESVPQRSAAPSTAPQARVRAQPRASHTATLNVIVDVQRKGQP